MNQFAPITAEFMQNAQPAKCVTEARPYIKSAVQVHIPSKKEGKTDRWATAYRALATYEPNAEGIGMPGEGSAYFYLENGKQVRASIYREVYSR